MSDYATRFVSGLVGNPEDRFSDVAAQFSLLSFTIRDWNDLPDSIISSSEPFCECSGQIFLGIGLATYCQFDVSSVNYYGSDSDENVFRRNSFSSECKGRKETKRII